VLGNPGLFMVGELGSDGANNLRLC
jgi:hypothetical protein